MSYEIEKSVQGNFNQGNIELFGETAGGQCACNALFSVCWSVIRKVSLSQNEKESYIAGGF